MNALRPDLPPESAWPMVPLRYLLLSSDGGAWGNDPTSDADPIVLRSTEQAIDGSWRIIDPARRKLSETEYANTKLKVGDIVVTKSSGSADHIGKASLVTQEVQDIGASYSNFMQRLRAGRKIEPRFLAILMNNPIVRRQMAFLSNSTTGLANLSATLIGQVAIPVPPLGEQLRILTFLDRENARIDDLIEKKARFIELLDEKEKAEISRLVRLGISKNNNLVDTGVDWRGKAPAHWAKGRLKDHFRLEKRQGYDHLTVLSVYREFGVIEKSSRDDNINKTPEDLSRYQLVNPGDLVINKMKAWQGSMGIASMQGITSPDYVVMRPIDEHDSRYIHHFLRARPMPWVYRLISNGIREDQWRMEPEKFLGLPIFLPPLEEQKAIANEIDRELERIRTLIARTERSIDLLKEKRAGLITAAVTGKIEVRNAT